MCMYGTLDLIGAAPASYPVYRENRNLPLRVSGVASSLNA